MTVTDMSFSRVFSRALRGEECAVVGLGAPTRLPVARWTAAADAADEHLLDHCAGPTLDVGCGPGRLTAALAARGAVALGIDVVPEAVGQARDRGGTALHRDVFGRLPGEGRWETVLLADGNIGIGGDPVALLRRTRELLSSGGRVVVEVGAPGVGATSAWAVLEAGGVRSRPFRWAVVGADAIAGIAGRCGFRAGRPHPFADRWCAVLEAA
jgi:SAM-dependent methyltransferase